MVFDWNDALFCATQTEVEQTPWGEVVFNTSCTLLLQCMEYVCYADQQ
jgi:carbamoylphosphate synthase small subunit